MACTRHARCRLCSEDIIFTCGNPVELGFHMIDRHSSGSVVQYSIHDDCSPEKCPRSARSSSHVGRDTHVDCAKMWDDVKRCGNRKMKRKMGLYKTTLETWTTGGCTMICPKCSKEVKPLICTQKNKVAHTSLGATFLLSCWPFCFMFPLQHKCSVDLYCPICKQKLGLFDTTTGMYRTNDNVIINNPDQIPNIKRRNFM